MSKAVIYFDKKNHARKYEYDFPYPEIASKENIAMAISEAMVIQNKKKASRMNLKRYYNLIIKLIENTNIHSDEGLTIDVMNRSYLQASVLNSKEKPLIINGKVKIRTWRVGLTQSNHLVIDIDNHDIENHNRVLKFYSNLFGYRFETIITGNGFWLIGKHEYDSKENWLYDNCRVLCPELIRSQYRAYRGELLSMDSKDSKVTENGIRASNLYSGIGNFDLLFIFINIKRECCTLRHSMKHEGDKIIQVNL